MKLIKLTNNGITRDNTKWEIGKAISIPNDKRKPELCSDGVLHAYESIEQALAMKANHGYSSDKALKILEVEGNIEVKKYDKVGSYELTPIKEITLPDWYLNEDLRKKIFVRFACYCALEVIDIFEEKYPNDDRPRKAIKEAMKYGSDKFDIDTCDAAYDAVCAARAAARAAAYVNAVNAAAYDADADAAAAANAAAYAADAAAAHAADAAARAAARADINITDLMKKAISDFV